MRELESLAEDDAQPMYIGMFVWLVPTCVCVFTFVKKTRFSCRSPGVLLRK